MMKKVIVQMFIAVLVLSASGQLFAQNAQSDSQRILSLDDCIRIALDNKVDVKIAQEQLNIATAQNSSAFGQLLPRVSASVNGSRNVQGEGQRFFSGIEFTTPESQRNYYSAGLNLDQTLFAGGALHRGRKYSSLNLDQAEVAVNNAKERVVLNVTAAYFDVLRARELVQVYEKTLESSEAQVELVQERFNLGAVAKSDVFKAQTNAGNDRINLLQQENTLKMRQRDLNFAMGRNPATPVGLPDFDYESPEIPDLEEAKSLAITANKDLQELEYQAQKSKVNVAIARANLLPSVGASFGYDRSGFQFEELYNDLSVNWSYRIGLGVSVPIFSRFNNRTTIQTRQAQATMAERDYEDAKLQVGMQVENLIDQLETYEEIIRLNELNLQSAQEDLRLAKERYNIGQATLLDVLDAQAALTNAQRILVYAKFDAKNQEARLEAVLGRLLDETDA